MMKWTKIKIAAAIVGAVALGGSGGAGELRRAAAGPPAQADQADKTAVTDGQTELSKLEQEHVATLRKGANMAEQMFAHGLGAIADVNRLNQSLVEAELKYAKSSKERASILQDELTTAKKQEELASRQAAAGIATVLAPVEAKAYRLGIEIELSEETSP